MGPRGRHASPQYTSPSSLEMRALQYRDAFAVSARHTWSLSQFSSLLWTWKTTSLSALYCQAGLKSNYFCFVMRQPR